MHEHTTHTHQPFDKHSTRREKPNFIIQEWGLLEMVLGRGLAWLSIFGFNNSGNCGESLEGTCLHTATLLSYSPPNERRHTWASERAQQVKTLVTKSDNLS